MKTAKIEELLRRLDSAMDKRRKGDYSGALEEFTGLEAMSDHEQDIATLRLFQTTCLTDLGRVLEASNSISRIDKNNLRFSDQIDYEFERARIARASDKRPAALDIVTTTLRTIQSVADKSDISIITTSLHTLHGILLAELGRCEEAAPLLDNVPTQDQGWIEAKICRGDCCIKTGQFKEAIDHYQEVLSCDKDVDPVFINDATRNIGVARYYLGQYAESIHYLTKVRSAYETYPSLKAEIFEFLALAHLRLGNIVEAEEFRALQKSAQTIQ